MERLALRPGPGRSATWCGQALLVIAWPAVVQGQVTADQDFAARCAAPGVVKCVGFDNTTSDIVPGVNLHPDGAGVYRAGLDTAQKASGAGSLRFALPPPPHAGSNIAGQWLPVTNDGLGALFGQHSTFYLQFRQRFSPEMLANTWDSSWKTAIFHYNQQSCGSLELATNNYYLSNLVHMYTDCGARSMTTTLDGTQWTPDPPLLMQQVDYPCEYGDLNPTDCFYFVPGEWLTFYYRVQIGAWDVPNSTIEAWVKRDAWSGYRQFVRVPSFALSCNTDPCTQPPGANQGYNNLTLTPYMTGLSPSSGLPGVTSFTWYDELIVSRQPIAFPAAGLPAIRLSDAAVPEGDAGPSGAVFTARLAPPSAQEVTVAFATGGGTAAAGTDYEPAAGTLTFPAGATTRPVAVNVLGDTAVEPDETFAVTLQNPLGASLADGQGDAVILDDDAPSLSSLELAHGTRLAADLAGGTPDLYRLAQAPRSSYEVVLDAASGDLGPGLRLERLAADNAAVVQAASPEGTGTALSLRWQNSLAAPSASQHLRVSGGACGASCGPDDVYRLRVYDTTAHVPRFNNSGSQVTVLLLQNATHRALAAQAHFWSAEGAWLHSQALTLPPRGSQALHTASLPELQGQGGSITVSHDGPHGALAGKAVALEPSGGFSFDSTLATRAR